MGKKMSQTLTDWTHCIFGKEDEFSKDYESTDLEAYIAYGMCSSLLMKVPFGHRRLRYGLKQVMSTTSRGGSTTFKAFMGSSPLTKAMIDNVVRVANRMQKRERTLLTCRLSLSATPDSSRPFVVVFLTIQPEKQHIAFTDALGFNYSLPFGVCKNWKVSCSTQATGIVWSSY